MFKDGPLFIIVVQSGNMPHFRWCIFSSGQILDNLFTSFERNYVGIVFDAKISTGYYYVFAGERLKNSQNSTFLKTPSRRHGLEGW